MAAATAIQIICMPGRISVAPKTWPAEQKEARELANLPGTNVSGGKDEVENEKGKENVK